eukprot:SAG11_NODE_2725_length_3041_cov_5.351462_2_plen_186_part_00
MHCDDTPYAHAQHVCVSHRDHLKVDGCKQFDTVDMNNSYAIVGSHLLAAATKRGTTPIVYHPSNLGFRHPRQFHELVAIANQWRWFDDVQDTWESVSGIIEEVCLDLAGSSAIACLLHQILYSTQYCAPEMYTTAVADSSVSRTREANKNSLEVCLHDTCPAPGWCRAAALHRRAAAGRLRRIRL